VRPINQEGRTVTPFPYFKASSSDPYERGRQLGEASADYVRGSIDVYQETFAHYAKLDWDQVRTFASEFRDPIAEYDEQIMAEMDGIAAGAGVPAEDILAVNARTEIMFGAGAKGPSECTSFYVGPTATPDGHVLVGQNWDWRTRCTDTTILAEVDQGGTRPSFVMLAEGALVGKLGFNDAGIGVAANALVADLDKGERQVPFHIILRGILNSHTVEEALSAIVRSRRAASANYVIASATGRGVGVETGPGGVESVYLTQPTADLYAHSNHFTCGVTWCDIGVTKWLDSPGRISSMGKFLDDNHGALSREKVAEGMRNHDGHPNSVCRHPDTSEHEVEQGMTVASWIIDLTAMSADITCGPPCESDYEVFRPSFAAVGAESTD
jgi:isopenicillin-N N-acyltransferase-like protein